MSLRALCYLIYYKQERVVAVEEKRKPKKMPFKNRLPSEERKTLILDAAGRVLCEYGYDGATLDKIARAADISKTLIVSYYQSKENLAKLFIERYMDALELELRRIAAQNTGDARQVMDAMFGFVRETRAEFRLIVSIVSTPKLAESMRELMFRYFDAFQAVFAPFAAELGPARLKTAVYQYLSMLVAFSIGGNVENITNAKEELIAHYFPGAD